MLPAFFASKIAIRSKGRTHTSQSPKGNKKSLPHQGKKILIKNHQFVRLLNTAYIAYKFQFFPWLPVKKIPTLSLLYTRPRVQGRVGKKS